jgi:glycerophosphoryl diester phosphodiesterase
VTSKPLLLGHRGCRGRRRAALPVENSVDAFEYALQQGCDGFEFDVRHTRDGHNVLWHDPKWHGIEIAATDFADLTDRSGARIPLLEDVLSQFAQRSYLDIELKVSGNEASVIAAVKAQLPQRGFVVSSFYPEILTSLRALDATLPLGFLCDREKALAVWREMPISVFLPQESFVRPSLIEEAHLRGLQIMTWTVNDARRMRELAAWGIDGIISDDPQLLYQTFHSE